MSVKLVNFLLSGCVSYYEERGPLEQNHFVGVTYSTKIIEVALIIIQGSKGVRINDYIIGMSVIINNKKTF